jgi:tetratricopeptide (TPR) repeat protein
MAIRLNNLAALLQTTNRLAEAEPLMRRALEIFKASYGESHPNVSVQLNNLAQLLQVTNRLAEAEPLMRCALAIDEQSYGKSHPDVARDLGNLARLLQATNRLAEAKPMMRRMAIIILQFTVQTGYPHPHLRTALRSYAVLCEEMKVPEEEFWLRLLGMCRAAGMDDETAKKILASAFQ